VSANENSMSAWLSTQCGEESGSKPRYMCETSASVYCPTHHINWGTNNLPVKWDWFNYGDMRIKFIVGNYEYTVGINEAESTWKTKLSVFDEQFYEATWDYSSSNFNCTDDWMAPSSTTQSVDWEGTGETGGEETGGIPIELPALYSDFGDSLKHEYHFTTKDSVSI